MSIGITEELRALADAVAGVVARHAGPEERRTLLDSSDTELAALRQALAEQGVLGLHVGEEYGGSGYGLEELAVVAEQLGKGLAPGALVPTLLAGALLAADGGPAAKEFLPTLVDGTHTAAVALASGAATVVLGGAAADFFLVPRQVDDTTRWAVARRDEIQVEPVASLDLLRPVARVSLADAVLPAERILEHVSAQTVAQLATVVLSAEAAGVAAWCLDTAVEYAKVREQFGRPIGQFQGVKHRCAEMLVRVEQARSAAWDAARAVHDNDEAELATAVAAAIAVDAAHDNALETIQILGGLGFTWEHDAHLYLRRATATRQLLGGGSHHRRQVADLALAGHRRTLHLDLDGDEADGIREEVRAFLATLDGLDEDARRGKLAESGFQVPHWPAPWGRDASPVEQLVIDEEFAAAGVERPNLFIGGWILPTIIAYGSPEQQEQFLLPTLRGEITWCQLFSEPEAGSDLAALQCRAEKVDGGWRITGQKVWTSLAHRSDWGLLLARTDPDAPKHDGITAFLLDMQHTDGIEIRPLKEMTGHEMFNEVYLDGAFIPDALVVGPVNGGWKAARNTLANERVAMSSGSAMGSGVEKVVVAFEQSDLAEDPVARDRLGGLVATGQVLGLLGFRTTLAQLSGVEPGAASSVRKLVGGHHSRDCAEFTLELLGPIGATTQDGAAAGAAFMFLQTQCLTIAGGTTNVQLNVIAERLLGLPRD